MKCRTFLLFGAPGSGKGTQGKILGAIPGFFHCSCGDVFRNLTIENDIGRIFVEHSSRGELVPDEPTITLWRQSIEAAVVAGRFHPEQDTLVLDGIPRNVNQARMLQDTLDVSAIFNLTCSDMSKMIARLQRRALRENRLDDTNLEIIQHRLETYEKETRPVLDFYGPKLVHNIDSTKDPGRVVLDILNAAFKLN